MVFKKVLDFVTSIGGNTLYYPGCLTKFAAPELEEKYKHILKKMNVDFIEIDEFNCCGSPVINAGYAKDFYDLVKKNKEIFKKYGITRIVSNCPSCAKMFRDEYEMNSIHMTQLILKNIKKFKPIETAGTISFHDPCHLGRGMNLYQEPRDILTHLGFEIVEMKNNRKNSLCCGGGGGLRTNNPALAKIAAKNRVNQCKTKKLITSCPLCYKNLKENAPSNIEVMEISEVLL